MPIPTEVRPPRPLLRDDVLERMRDAIVDGTLTPGEQVRDADLATWLGVSRTPVREALLELGRAGLVLGRRRAIREDVVLRCIGLRTRRHHQPRHLRCLESAWTLEVHDQLQTVRSQGRGGQAGV